MKKSLSSTAFIVNIATISFITLFNIFNCIICGQYFDYLNRNEFPLFAIDIVYIVFLSINFIILAIAIITSICLLIKSQFATKRFLHGINLKKGIVVINFIEMIFIVTIMILSYFTIGVNLLSLMGDFINFGICFIGLVISITLSMFDLSFESFRRKGDIQKKATEDYGEDVYDEENFDEKDYVEENFDKVNVEFLEKELSKLNELKMAQLIDEEDFNKMKQGMISKYIGG